MGQSKLDGGFDAARVAGGDAAENVRAVVAARARSNLARLLVDEAGGEDVVRADPQLLKVVAAQFAELAAVLGLEAAPERDPGCCGGCGRPMVITARAVGGSRATWKRGFCSDRCEKTARLGEHAKPGGGG